MSSNKKIFLILGLAVIVSLSIVVLKNNETQQPGPMMMQNMPRTIDDKTFLLNMIPHHQEAVDTANEVLERGGVIPEVKTLVENIIEAQTREIADMKMWYEDWYGEPYEYAGGYKPMMRELEGLEGKDIDLTFTNDMWMHHMGALHLAQAVLQNTKRDELITMGNNILVTQREEMILMRQILQKNSGD